MGIGQLVWGLLVLWTLWAGVTSAQGTAPRQYVFLVDTSASMIGREDGRTVIFPQVQRELIRFAERVADEAEIRIVPFSGEPQDMARFVLPREREEMLRYIRSLRAEGNSSFIYRSLNKVYGELCSEPRSFYLFTDGLDNSAEPARMPVLNHLCPLTLVALGGLPQNFASSWKGLRQSSLAEGPGNPWPSSSTEKAAPAGPYVATADPTSSTGNAQLGSQADTAHAAVQKEFVEEPSPQTSSSSSLPPETPLPQTVLTPPPSPPQTAPTMPQSQPKSVPAVPQPQLRVAPTVPKSQPQAVPNMPKSPPVPRSSAPEPPAQPRPTPAPVPIQPSKRTVPHPSPSHNTALPAKLTPPPATAQAAPQPIAGSQPPKPAQYLLRQVGSASLVDGAVVVYHLEGTAEATLPLELSLKEVPPALQVSYNDNPTGISLRPGEQFELRVSNQSAQEALLETSFRVASAPGALVELPPVLLLKVPPMEVSRGRLGWVWALVGLLGALLMGLGLRWTSTRLAAPRGEPAEAAKYPGDGLPGLGEVRVLRPPTLAHLVSLDFFGAAPEQRRKYIPALLDEYDLGEVTGDPALERLRVRPGFGGLEVIHIPGHLSLFVEAKDPVVPGQTVELGRTVYISDISSGAAVGILSSQRV